MIVKSLASGALALIVSATLTACGSESSTGNGGTSPAPIQSVVTVTQAAAPSSSTAQSPSSSAKKSKKMVEASKSWKMPDEVGMDLQDAQNDIQDLTDYGIAITHSRDASGQDRFQILDHDWKVCSQNVDAGSRITADTRITFSVVKQDETCP